MSRLKRRTAGAPAERHRLDLGRGVIVHARRLDPFEHAAVFAEIFADLDAAAEPEAAKNPSVRRWALTEARAAAIGAQPFLRMVYQNWMRAVLLAEKAVLEIEGLAQFAPDDLLVLAEASPEEAAEASPASLSFELFATLFSTASFEAAFSAQFAALDAARIAEGNGSGRGRNMDSAAGSDIAGSVANSNPPAPEDSPSTPLTGLASVPSTNTPPEPLPAPSPGGSPQVAEAGDTPALPAA